MRVPVELTVRPDGVDCGGRDETGRFVGLVRPCLERLAREKPAGGPHSLSPRPGEPLDADERERVRGGIARVRVRGAANGREKIRVGYVRGLVRRLVVIFCVVSRRQRQQGAPAEGPLRVGHRRLARVEVGFVAGAGPTVMVQFGQRGPRVCQPLAVAGAGRKGGHAQEPDGISGPPKPSRRTSRRIR